MSGQSVPLHDHGRAEALQDVLLILSEKYLRLWVRRQRALAFPAGMRSVALSAHFPDLSFLVGHLCHAYVLAFLKTSAMQAAMNSSTAIRSAAAVIRPLVCMASK
jgi:hypothetical protein